MYLSDRQQPKSLSYIDEAGGNCCRKITSVLNFIEENGYRTTRKYNGAYIPITQGDRTSTDESQWCNKTAQANSPFKIILRQNRDAFP